MVTSIVASLSARRFATYLKAAGHNEERAIALYLWNAKLGASFHLPVQAAEVALRNRINHALVAQFGPHWWRSGNFLQKADRQRMSDLEMVRKRLAHKAKAADTDQIVASLSFGFWVGMLHRRYNPEIWSRHLSNSFPDLPPQVGRQTLFDLTGKVQRLRNRISHHEPLIGTDVLQAYGDLMTLLEWVCPETAAWIRPHCDTPRLMREKP